MKEFVEVRQKLNLDIKALQKKTIGHDLDKLDTSKAAQVFQQIRDLNEKNKMSSEDVKNNLITLENYCERYQPLHMCKILQKILTPVFTEEEQGKSLKRAILRYNMELQTQILTDVGQGSIFEQIITINDEMSERLKFRVDLQEDLFRSRDTIAKE